MWVEMKPDVYAGDKCDEIAPRFECFCDGDMGSDYIDVVNFKPSELPPGARILVEVPCCPKCYQDVEMCKADDGCDFDWDEWCYNEYS